MLFRQVERMVNFSETFPEVMILEDISTGLHNTLKLNLLSGWIQGRPGIVGFSDWTAGVANILRKTRDSHNLMLM